MADAEGFRQELEELSSRVLESLGGSGKSAWELKMELKVSHTALHLALGMLIERGRLTLAPESLTHRVVPAGADAGAPSPEPAGGPVSEVSAG